MRDEDLDVTVDWSPGKGFSNNTRATRRLDQKKIAEIEASDRNNFKKKSKQPKKINPNIKKIKNKIRDVYDDDEDEEEEGNVNIIFDFTIDDPSSSLYGALNEQEKSRINAEKEVENHKMQQTAGKVAGIVQASQMSKSLGLKKMNKKIIFDNIQDVTFDGKTFEKALMKNISNQTNIKTDNLSEKETANLVKGLMKMKKANILSEGLDMKKATENMDAKDIVEIGKTKDNNKTAKLILEKSGRKDEKNKSKDRQTEQREQIKKIERALSKNNER